MHQANSPLSGVWVTPLVWLLLQQKHLAAQLPLKKNSIWLTFLSLHLRVGLDTHPFSPVTPENRTWYRRAYRSHTGNYIIGCFLCTHLISQQNSVIHWEWYIILQGFVCVWRGEGSSLLLSFLLFLLSLYHLKNINLNLKGIMIA